MRKTVKLLALMAGMLIGSVNGWLMATPIANLNFTEPTTLPTAYTYSNANKPSIVTNGGKSCVYLTNGGGGTAPTVTNGVADVTTGKRWIAFTPDEDCTVVISVYSNKKKFSIYDNGASTAKDTYTNSAKAWEDWTVTGLQAGHCYVITGSNSQMYVSAMNYTASGSTPPTPPTPSSDATLSDLQVDGVTVAGFASATLNYSYTVPSSQTTLPVVSATTTNAQATPVITQTTSMTGQASVLVTAADGTTQQTYTVQFSQSGSVDPPTPPTPPTPTVLTLHETEVYEAPAIMGGYGGTLSTFGGREYEVYYINRDANSNQSVAISNTDKAGSITTPGATDYECAASDGWFLIKASGNGGETGFAAAGEFQQSVRKINMKGDSNGNLVDSIVMHVKGYSEFALVGKDNSTTTGSKEKRLKVFVDGVLRDNALNNNYSIRRYPLTTGEHVIKVGAVGSSNSVVLAFSLQVAYVPKLKHLKGNDSTQVVSQTASIKPVTYYLKNRISDAELVWNGYAATGITLQQNAAGDTLTLQGTANCPVGTYQYTIQAKDSANTVVSSLSGSFSVDTKVECTSGSLTTSVFANSAIKPVVFRCYTTDMNNVTSQWTGATPAGLSFTKDANNHTLTLSGTPTQPGTYAYTVSVSGGNTLEGTVTVKNDQPTVLPGKPTLLYLYKNTENDGLYSYITSSQKYGYFARPAAETMAAANNYASYDAVVISEDVDATNNEVLDIIRSLQKPVINMKVFTYSKSRLGWGDPDNGSISNTKIKVLRSSHAIFAGLNSTNGEVTVLSAVSDNKGLMPAEVSYAGTVCLATAPKRGENYSDDGEPQTLIHEVPASMRGGAKYISLPIGLSSTANLTLDGKKLFDNIISYLTAAGSSGAEAPTIQITGFSINGVAGIIDQQAKTILVNLPAGTNLSALTPQVTLADNKLTYVTPGSGETVDFSDLHYGVVYTVSDYITKVRYTAKVRVGTGLENAENDGLWVGGSTLYNPEGVWVNIFSMSGQLLTTTNSDFSFDKLPRGMYIVKSENNTTLKVLH